MDETTIYEARLEVIDFLIEVFYDAPSEEFLDRLFSDAVTVPDGEINEPMDRGFRRLEAFIEANRSRSVADVADDLRTEYTRLFVGPRPPALPHETYYRDDTEFIGEGLAKLEADYSAAGWTPHEDYPEENDHLAVELAFLRNLVDRQRRGEEAAFGYERVFLDEHVGRWNEAFLETVREELDEPVAEANLFLAASEVFVGLVEFEDELVAQQVPS
ncbi:chaperone TorD involved in molybdoenzyme TorA maturation [Halopenitus malekzadehii]|uniref:Chaperone TorD involved in molybdoenzyme TorA maturation n=1 Tax=Halopenitus malekzadehii TaxID=1267564 RepID=A0A1H6IA10_9EURY|nr:molecular chaperone TorD family protein [Halopenitus malekzadehii]SEH43858.1 chaperone TorD involved in molybdoenzyme TorA maturation [Halopenitus malekzadehii]